MARVKLAAVAVGVVAAAVLIAGLAYEHRQGTKAATVRKVGLGCLASYAQVAVTDVGPGGGTWTRGDRHLDVWHVSFTAVGQAQSEGLDMEANGARFGRGLGSVLVDADADRCLDVFFTTGH